MFGFLSMQFLPRFGQFLGEKRSDTAIGIYPETATMIAVLHTAQVLEFRLAAMTILD